jgi:hypothetical protein
MILVKFVRLFHNLLVLFILLTPVLTNDRQLLSLHFAAFVGILVHWLLNNNKCWLTEVENNLRHKPLDTSFIKSKWHLDDRGFWFILLAVPALSLWKLSKSL